MADKVQKIRKEVEKLKLCTMDEHMKFYSECAEAEYNALCKVEEIVDSLQEEPVSEDILDVSRIDYRLQHKSIEDGIKYHAEEYSFNIESVLYNQLTNEQQELWRKELERAVISGGYYGLELSKDKRYKENSVSEDLGEYINELSKQFPEVSFAKLSRIAVRVAKWQKQQDQSTIELAEDHAMLAGMEKMKEQMMAKAIDGLVICDKELTQGYKDIVFSVPNDLKVDDKVKMIIIKED